MRKFPEISLKWDQLRDYCYIYDLVSDGDFINDVRVRHRIPTGMCLGSVTELTHGSVTKYQNEEPKYRINTNFYFEGKEKISYFNNLEMAKVFLFDKTVEYLNERKKDYENYMELLEYTGAIDQDLL